MKFQNTARVAGLMALLVMLTGAASASTFKTITIDDLYADWAGVPVLDSDPLDNVGFIDIAETQIANDGTFLYIRTTYHTENSVGTFVAIDNDNSAATGFDIFGLGLVGSEAGYSNDFDFDQRGGFNIGTLKDPVNAMEPASGAAAISSFVDSTSREIAIRLDTFFDPAVGTGDVFPTDNFTILVWTDQGVADVSAAIPYTLAIPEPSTSLLLGSAAAGLLAVRRIA